jgi:hypothetical protein
MVNTGEAMIMGSREVRDGGQRATWRADPGSTKSF